MEITKKDWALYRERLPVWQERHMERLNQDYLEILLGPGQASDKFWAVWERIEKDRDHPGVIVRRSRSNVLPTLVILVRDGVISEDELEGFSEELRSAVCAFLGRSRSFSEVEADQELL